MNEIFLRRAYEFQFDEKHMKKEIKNFVRRLNVIKFATNINEKWAGYYNSQRDI